jgi:O-antigen ligase
MKLAPAPLGLARGLLAAVMVALLFSPPLTSLLELALFATILASGELRARFMRAAREPLGALALAFWGVVTIGLAYGIAPRSEALHIWLSWHRVLLLIAGLALYDSAVWKRRIAWLLVGVATVAAIASYAGAFSHITLRHFPPGIILRTQPFQGMVFSVAAFAALLLLRYAAPTRALRLLLGTSAALLVANVVFITPGRSGYVVLIVCAVALVLERLRERSVSPLRRLAWAAAAGLAALAMLASSPTVRERIALGLEQIEHYDQGAEVSSMGERVIYQRNGLALLAERPLTGYGTGSFETAYTALVAGRSGREGLKVHDPHNQYLNVAVQHGLPGLAVFLAVLVAAFRRPTPPPWRALALGVLAGWCLTSLLSSHFSTFGEGRFIWLWLGVCLARDG